MKNFNLKECGVSEISQRELVIVNGGNALIDIILKVAQIAVAAGVIADFCQGFVDGFSAEWNK
ncbi:MAG: class IIb bacteriocin, lactobin A/cerein 7B family [Bacteroidetes bacterium]|nr:class IIb bacteriocin, lactobin A/cerein 7B family [Bacteroidota bacterium]